MVKHTWAKLMLKTAFSRMWMFPVPTSLTIHEAAGAGRMHTGSAQGGEHGCDVFAAFAA